LLCRQVFDLEIEHMVFFGKSLLWVLRDALGSKWTTGESSSHS
jgi:hypothetical protein